MATTYWKDLITIPDAVQASDFVLKLSDGVLRAKATVDSYVVTTGVARAFDEALGLIGSSLQGNSSKATYLHGSFGSGKSHFMAVLDLLLDREHSHLVRGLKGLSGVIVKHDEWLERSKLMMVPYHFLTATSVEACILGGYVEHVKRVHPDAPIPAVYRSASMLKNASEMRDKLGDESFFKMLGGNTSNWFSTGWDPESWDAAAQADPGSESHQRLVSALVTNLFTSMSTMASTSEAGGGYVDIDNGLAIMSQHAKSLGYDGVVLFLDELILWMSQRAGKLEFVRTEAEKLSKLVEAQNADRPVPIVSFVARQRSLIDFVGNAYTGQDRATFDFSIQSLQGRFGEIRLEDRDLPVIVHQRLLKPVHAEAGEQIVQSFERFKLATDKRLQEMMRTTDSDEQTFEKTYPFSPALIQSLVALSTFLQRERTALRLLLLLLVTQREELALGHVVPVGDLWDVVTHGDAPFSEALRRTYQTASDLWKKKLKPMLVHEHRGYDPDDASHFDSTKHKAFQDDARILKTLLIASLVPEVESLKEMTVDKLTALNISAIHALLPGMESGQVEQKLRRWASNVGEIRLSDEPGSPRITLQLSTLDVEVLLDRVEAQDTDGARRRKIRELLFEWLGLPDTSNSHAQFDMNWRGGRRRLEVHYRNVRSTRHEDFERAQGKSDFALIIDYPFDEGNFKPSDDFQNLENYRREHAEDTNVMVWLPNFLTQRGKQRLGRLVKVEYVLKHFDDYANSYAQDQRSMLRPQLESLQSALRNELKFVLGKAYGLSNQDDDMVDESYALKNHFISLRQGLEYTSSYGRSFEEIITSIFTTALTHRYPDMPALPDEALTSSNARKILAVFTDNVEGDGMATIIEDRPLRKLLKDYAPVLELGKVGEDRFQHVKTWRDRLERAMHTPEFKEVLKAQHGELKVQHVRELIDPPLEPVGYPPVVQDLIVSVYMTLEQMALYHLNIEQELEPGKLHHAARLVRRELPDEEVWQHCIKLGQEMFGIKEEFHLLGVKAVSRLDEALRREASAHRELARDHVKVLNDRGAQLMPGGASELRKTNRYKCAHKLEALLDMSSTSDDATARLKKVAALTQDIALVDAMRAQYNNLHKLKKSASTITWQSFTRAVEMEAKGTLAPTALELLERAREIFREHEYIRHFSEISDISERLFKLLTSTSVPATTPAIKPVIKPVKAAVMQSFEVHASTDLDAWLLEIRELLGTHPGDTFTVTFHKKES